MVGRLTRSNQMYFIARRIMQVQVVLSPGQSVENGEIHLLNSSLSLIVIDNNSPQTLLYRLRPKRAIFGGGPFNIEFTSTFTSAVFKTACAASIAAFAIRCESDAEVSAYSGHLPHNAWLQCGLVRVQQ